uniref:COX6C domain-containing protein n=1 Tax=Syphacia muris TaxID=451379 RepID=A0A0N5A9B0_9BILA
MTLKFRTKTLQNSNYITISVAKHISMLKLAEVIGTVLLHGWTHFIGYYAYTTREKICRATFLRARNAFAAEERALQENLKLNSEDFSHSPQHLTTVDKIE